ncbi:MAG TPA: hypothetical protein VF062_25495 [Candidatus Limnocylindrales bacterium]
MLEDDLRKMFGARVHTPLAAMDPAGKAITRARGRRLRRRLLTGGIGGVTLVAMVLGMAMIQGVSAPVARNDGPFMFDTFDGFRGEQLPDKPMQVIDMPIDVHQGTALWTSDGRRMALPGVEQVIDVIRVPQGWLYSDDIQLRLLTTGGQTVPVRENVSSWMVSDDGAQVASVSTDSTLAVQPSGGGETQATTPVPDGTLASGFDEKRVIVSRDGSGPDTWDPGDGKTYVEGGQLQLAAVYTAAGQAAVGIVHEGAKTCLAELSIRAKGWLVGTKLGCADLMNHAAQAGQGINRATRSPDGRWLAVPSPTGVHLIDIEASRQAIRSSTSPVVDGPPVFGFSCVSSPDAPAVWADASTVLTISTANGVVACNINGSRYAVALPAGVSDGWGLVRRYGVKD